LPGLHITDHQMRLYMSSRQSNDTTVAAAKADLGPARGISGDPLDTIGFAIVIISGMSFSTNSLNDSIW
jgi:hypothetical protein